MTMDDPSSVLSAVGMVERIGIIGLLALAVWALVAEWVVPGKRLRESEEQRKKAEDVADDLLAAVHTVKETTSTIVRLVESLPRASSREGDHS